MQKRKIAESQKLVFINITIFFGILCVMAAIFVTISNQQRCEKFKAKAGEYYYEVKKCVDLSPDNPRACQSYTFPEGVDGYVLIDNKNRFWVALANCASGCGSNLKGKYYVLKNKGDGFHSLGWLKKERVIEENMPCRIFWNEIGEVKNILEDYILTAFNQGQKLNLDLCRKALEKYSHIFVGLEKKDGKFVLTVEDEGCGQYVDVVMTLWITSDTNVRKQKQ